MERELTIEESDALILQEMGLAEDNSISNEQEVTEDEETQEVTEDVETETDEVEEEQEEKVEPRKPNKVAKILHQRNEARKEAEEAKTLAQTLQARLDELTAEWNYWSEEYVQTLVDKRIAEADEKQEFFENNEELRGFKKDILNYAKETWLPLEKASKLYLAENNPELLLDPQTRNKQKSKIYWTPAITPKSVKEWEKLTYSDAEFELMAKKGLISF